MTNAPYIPEPARDPQDTPVSAPQYTSQRDLAAQMAADDQAYGAQPDDTQRGQPSGRGTGLLSAVLYGSSFLITVGAAAYYLSVSGEPPANPGVTPIGSQTQSVIVEASPGPTTETATALPVSSPEVVTMGSAPVFNDQVVPVDVAADLLLQPGQNDVPSDALYRQQNPFTIAPVRPRSGVTQYTIQQGDTLDKIAARFGISTDTLVWNNDGIYVNRLYPGDRLTILPESGVLHKTLNEETVQSIADKYKVSPYAIIDSEYNRLQYAKPTTILPGEFSVVIPGGTSDKKAVFWDPGIKVSNSAAGNGTSARSNVISFGGGQSGSCGNQGIGGGSGGFILPIAAGSYVITRGFTGTHGGIDMATSAGRTVFAADSGTVIFAGWSTFGYGNTVVISHGSFLTLYGHLSAISASCGQQVGQGTPVGAVGSTGVSSGAHLHFEIRPAANSYYPANPRDYMGF